MEICLLISARAQISNCKNYGNSKGSGRNEIFHTSQDVGLVGVGIMYRVHDMKRLFEVLKEHMFHDVEIIGYGTEDDDSELVSLAFVCNKCNQTLIEIDKGDTIYDK